MQLRHYKPAVLTAALLLAGAVAVWLASSSAGGSPGAPRNLAFEPCPHWVLPEGKLIEPDHNRRAARSIVPMTPTEVQLCRYWGTGYNQTQKTLARAGKLASERVLRRTGVVRPLAREFHNLRMYPEHGTGEFTCPADEGATLYAIFHYASEPDVSVSVRLSGCPFAWNGRRMADAGLIREKLERLTRATGKQPD